MHEVDPIGAAFDGERTLSRRGETDVWVEERANAGAETEPLQARGGENDRAVAAFVELAQPRVHVAAQRFDADLGMALAQLRFTPQARRADDGAGRQRRQRVEAVGYECIARVLARRYRREDEAVRYVHRHVLQRMN